MEALKQLERDYQKANEKGACPELLRKFEDQITRLKSEEFPGREDIPFIGKDLFEDLFQQAADEISKWYTAGTLDYIRRSQRALYDAIAQAEDRLNVVWKARRN